MKLNLGSGSKKIRGHLSIDIYEADHIDQVVDLDQHPWPWADDSIERIVAEDIYEHVDRPLEFVNDAWRVLQTDAELYVRTTHWQTPNSYTDPTHKRFLTERSFDYWLPGREYHRKYGHAYSGGRHFELLDSRLDGQELIFVLLKRDRCEGAC